MTFCYYYYKEKDLRYFVDIVTRYYTSCILVKAKCSLFISKEE
jgi:hypothetical protein